MDVWEKLCFVQLIHPGGDPAAARGEAWNCEGHVRKFLRVRGQCVRDGCLEEGELDFWGEWEAESELAQEFRRPILNGPERVWWPHWVKKNNYRCLQNTDPFVFGGFYYTGCLQRRENGANQLRYLESRIVQVGGGSTQSVICGAPDLGQLVSAALFGKIGVPPYYPGKIRIC